MATPSVPSTMIASPIAKRRRPHHSFRSHIASGVTRPASGRADDEDASWPAWAAILEVRSERLVRKHRGGEEGC
jgi:hypothetical protein